MYKLLYYGCYHYDGKVIIKPIESDHTQFITFISHYGLYEIFMGFVKSGLYDTKTIVILEDLVTDLIQTLSDKKIIAVLFTNTSLYSHDVVSTPSLSETMSVMSEITMRTHTPPENKPKVRLLNTSANKLICNISCECNG